MKLEDLLKKASSDKIIIKCDVEGAETEIFNCNPAVLKGVYKMQIECHNSVSFILKQMKRFGFRTKTAEVHKGIFYKQVGYVLAWK